MAQTVSLPRRLLGQTGLEVTSLCIGCSSLGNMPETFGYTVAEAQALTTLRSLFESPLNFLDTAASYGDGEGERRLAMGVVGTVAVFRRAVHHHVRRRRWRRLPLVAQVDRRGVAVRHAMRLRHREDAGERPGRIRHRAVLQGFKGQANFQDVRE